VKLSDIAIKSLQPLLALNLTAMVFSGYFLLMSDFWQMMWPAILFLSLSYIAFPLVLFPAAFFSGMMQVLEKSPYPRVAKVMMACSLLWFVTLMSLTVMASLKINARAFGSSVHDFALIWSVAAAIAPWALFFTKDKTNLLLISFLWMLHLSAPAALCVYIETQSLSCAFWTCWGLMAVMVWLQRLYEKKIIENKSAA
jgi:hypothetical protein